MVFHSVVLDEDNCMGCTNCLKRCPTEAIRIKNKKAVIIKERCIDCGECIVVCPYHAQDSVTDELEDMNKFEYNIAIPSNTLYGQFSLDTDMDRVFQGILNMGFDYVYDEGRASDILASTLKDAINKKDCNKPVISSLCPAVIRLIQIRFPSLIDNIIRLESPMEIAARMAKKEIMEKYNIPYEKIGAFYLTPCPAKYTSIKEPLGIKKSYMDGAISIKKIYGDLVRNEKTIKNANKFEKGSSKGIGWSRVGGQSMAVGMKNYVGVDGIENVIKVLEEIENGNLTEIDYFEGYACIGGCVGGPLNVENPHIAKSRIRQIYDGNRNVKIYTDKEKSMFKELFDSGYLSWTEDIKAKSAMKIDDDIKKAFFKIGSINNIVKSLPGLDCGSCGAPSCKALAEDIVCGNSKLEDCIFMVKENVQGGIK